jgi:hypothetical protein
VSAFLGAGSNFGWREHYLGSVRVFGPQAMRSKYNDNKFDEDRILTHGWRTLRPF